MKITPETVFRATILVGGLLLGTGGTIGVQKATEAPIMAKPQVIEVKPSCPAIFLDNVKISR